MAGPGVPADFRGAVRPSIELTEEERMAVEAADKLSTVRAENAQIRTSLGGGTR